MGVQRVQIARREGDRATNLTCWMTVAAEDSNDVSTTFSSGAHVCSENGSEDTELEKRVNS